MDRRSVVIGSIGGIAVTVFVLLALPALYRSFERTRHFGDSKAFLLHQLGFMALGLVLGAAIIANKRFPMIGAVSALLLGYCYFVTTVREAVLFTWIPWTINLRLLSSLGVPVVVLVGILAGTSAWYLWRRSGRRSEPYVLVERRYQLVSVAAGVAVVAALLPVLRRLSLALWEQTAFAQIAGTRRAMLGLILVGVALAAVIVASERLPLLAASAGTALVLYTVVHPFFGLLPPDGPTSFMLFRFGPLNHSEVVLIAGLLAAVAVWRLIESRRVSEPDRVFGVGGERGEGLFDPARPPKVSPPIGG